MNDKKLLPHEVEKITQLAVEGLIKGYTSSQLSEEVSALYQSAPIEEVQLCIRRAIGVIKLQTLVDVDKIIPIHIGIYEQIYQWFDDMQYVPGKLKALRAKEKIVGLHRESNYVEVYNEVNAEIETDNGIYDISKLSDKEQKRLETLMKKIVK